MIDTKAIEEHIRGILVALGDDPDREGLRETPQRVAKMYEEVFAGMNYTNEEIAEMFSPRRLLSLLPPKPPSRHPRRTKLPPLTIPLPKRRRIAPK